MRNPVNVIPPAARPRVVLRYGNANELLVSGLLDNGGELAQHAAVIDAPYGQGHVVLFSNNPFWRAETKGSYFLVFNAVSYTHLDVYKRQRNPQTIIQGLPMFGNPLPWQTTELTPNLGKLDETSDMRPGLGWTGLARLQEFVHDGGLLITAGDTANFAVTFGFATGVGMAPAQRLKVTGSALRSKMVDAASPIVYGYADNLAIFASNPPVFSLSNMAGGGGRRRNAAEEHQRPTGRGTADDLSLIHI